MAQERIHQLDYLKGIFILLMVLFHSNKVMQKEEHIFLLFLLKFFGLYEI